jgi:L-amino acid N-acyltransferase YncA
MREDDYPQVTAIQQAGMDTGHATYEGETVTWEEFTSYRRTDLMFVADEEGTVLGWVTGSWYSHRKVFSGVVEDSIYVSPDATGRGVAGALLDHLIERATEQGFWSVHAVVFPGEHRVDETAPLPRFPGDRDRPHHGEDDLRSDGGRLAGHRQFREGAGGWPRPR